MNPITPTHEVTLPDGSKRALVYSHRAFATAEHKLRQQGQSVALLGPGSQEFWEGIGAEVETKQGKVPSFDQWKVGVLLFVGLLASKPTITLEEAQDYITFENAADMTIAVLAGVTNALAPLAQRMEAAADPDERPLAPGSGGPSAGPSDDTISG